jgi:hypothetical protein
MSWIDKFAPAPPPLQDDPKFYKFAPKERAPDAPQTAAVSVPSLEGQQHMQICEAILAYNNDLAMFKDAVSWTEPAKGVVIHKIAEADALAITLAVKAATTKYALPITYTLGCLAIESTLDPLCENGNFLGSNTAKDPIGYDMGIAQLKLRYLVGTAPNVKTVDDARAFAFNPELAIPYHCSLMATHVIWAQGIIDGNSSSAPDPRFNDPNCGVFLLATGAYNFGNTGMLAYYENGTFPSHCQHVIDLERSFAEKTGVVSVFSSLLDSAGRSPQV